ncbi:hypothetical protein JTE90_021214 [Oedothorax gibbosus]|uniref:BED-type domain-containing protein n=1 Tax=Oedothorax gibbosus TaxID=931172 RepID=A0AAV6TPG6_9ARAC|nr:hypothetical protein JTE90_021214 [Oedothorax gibbosus]
MMSKQPGVVCPPQQPQVPGMPGVQAGPGAAAKKKPPVKRGKRPPKPPGERKPRKKREPKPKGERKVYRLEKFDWTDEAIGNLINLRYHKIKHFKETEQDLTVTNLWLDVPARLGLENKLTPDRACKKWNQLVNKYKTIELKKESGTMTDEDKAWPHCDRIREILELQWTFPRPPQDSEFDLVQLAWEQKSKKHAKRQLKHLAAYANLPPEENFENNKDAGDDNGEPRHDGFVMGKRLHKGKLKRSTIWNYFTKLEDFYAECNVCKDQLSYKSSISNLLRHRRNMHPNLKTNYVPIRKFRKPVFSMLVHPVASKAPDISGPALCSIGQAAAAAQNVKGPAGKKSLTSGLKPSYLWNFFTILDKDFAECKTCKHKLVYRSAMSNLAKHQRVRHPLAAHNSTPVHATTSQSANVRVIIMKIANLQM